ncbi:MAG: hypothetical protein AAB036_00830 [Elusimicrobiota bacterium]
MRRLFLIALALSLQPRPTRVYGDIHLGMAAAAKKAVEKLDAQARTAAGSVYWTQYYDDPAIFTQTLNDPAGDWELPISEAPPSIIAYNTIDVRTIQYGLSGSYFYVRVDYAGTIPIAPIAVSGQTVGRQSTSFIMDTDNNNLTGANGESQGGVQFLGMDIYYGLGVEYGSTWHRAPYANYNFPTNDAHVYSGTLPGEWRSGGPGHTFVIARFNISGLGAYFPRGTTVDVGSWSEAESNGYHHFAFDPAPATTWAIPP